MAPATRPRRDPGDPAATGALVALAVSRDSPVRSLARLLRPDRWGLAGAVVAFVVKSSPAWLLPFFTARMIDVVVGHRPLRLLWLNAALLVLMIAQNLPTNMVYVRLQSRVIRDAELRLRAALTQRIQELSMGFHSTTGATALQTKVVRDVENVEQMLRQTFDLGLNALASIAGGLVLTAIQAPALLPGLVALVAVAGTTVSLLRRPLQARNRDFRQEVERLSTKVGEMTAIVPLTRAHGLEQHEIARIGATLGRVRTAGRGLDTANGFFNAAAWISYQLFQVVCLVGAAWLAWTQTLPVTAGDVVLVSSYMVTLTGSVLALTALAPIAARGLESVRSVAEVLDNDDIERNEGRRAVVSVQGSLRFAGVSARYPGAGGWAVRDLDLEVGPGTTVALVGPSGSGKSTVLNLVLGFLEPTRGRVLLDGQDLAELDLRTFRRHVSVVSQSTLLLDGTVRENVAFGLGDVAEDAVVRALRDAQAWEFVDALDEGLDTRIGPNGALLSGGQRQRVAIARALLRDPRVLLLDEATSALDPLSEARVQKALERLMAGRTTLVVAHRLSTVRSADRILVLEQGRVVEQGRHDELVVRGGRYARLHAGSLSAR